MPGTPYSLSYSSDWEPSPADRRITVPVIEGSVPDGLLIARLQVTVAGRTFVRRYAGPEYQGSDNPEPATPDLTATVRVRTTDWGNCTPTPCSASYNRAATTTDTDFGPIPIECVPNGSSSVPPGSDCNATTSANAFIPGFVVSGRQVGCLLVDLDGLGARVVSVLGRFGY